MVEARIQPGGRVVARAAGLREVRSHVTWIRCSLIVLQVTCGASGAGQVVVVVDVAIGALTGRHGVHACQRESCQRMIKRGIRPRRGVMAEITGLGERGAYVIRICGPLIVFQMASNTSSTSEVVVIVEVAVGALPRRHAVAAGQGKSDGAVIELGVEPIVRQVARCTVGGEMRGDVVRVVGLLEI